jgi:hypothetical protein
MLGTNGYCSLANRTWTFSVQEQFGRGYVMETPMGLQPVANPTASPLQTYYSTTEGLSGTVSYARRHLILSGTISHSGADANIPTAEVKTGNLNIDTRMIYKFRKLDIRAGYRNWAQSISSNGSLNQHNQTYWIEIVRQFHLF